MLVLHPKELPLVHQYYTPTEEEVASAKLMLELSETAKKEGKGVAMMNGKFIGPPMVETAKKILNRTELIQKKN